jgi:hypothetical protein
MKVLLITLLSLLSLGAYAQDASFPTSNATWHTLFTQYEDNGSGNVSYQLTSHFWIDGTTEIEGKAYTRLYVSGADSSLRDLSALYRVEGEKVYVHDDNGDFLFYDFGLELGDTFKAGNGGTFMVEKIDSIELNDGFHKVVDFGSSSFIRGVGSIEGIFAFMGPNVSGFSNELICFGVNNKALYPHYSDTACYELTNTASIMHPAKFFIEIFPNPASDILHISNIEPTDKVSLYRANGELVVAGIGIENLDVVSYSSGIYFVKIVRNGRSVYQNILLK